MTQGMQGPNGHPTGPSGRGRGWIAVLALGCVGAFAVGGAFAFFRGGDDQTIQTPGDSSGDATIVSTTKPDDSDQSTSLDDVNEPDDDAPGTDDGDDPDPDEPESGSDGRLDDGRPATFWAITSETYELVEVDTLSGVVLGRYGGWGSPLDECGEEDDCLWQAIDDVQLGPDGSLFVSDCCEPAVGNIYQVESGQELDPLAIGPRFYGTNPVPSPGGRLVAFDELGALSLRSIDSDETVSRFPEDGLGGGSGPWHTPLVWLDDTTIVFNSQDGEQASLGFLDVSDPTNPVQFGPTIDGSVFFDAGIRSDGNVLALIGTPLEDASGSLDILARVFSPETGDVIAEFDLPDSVYEIDYDSSDTYMITSGTDGVVRWYGAGSLGEIGSGFIAASW